MFMREGSDIHVEATVPLVDAILGADIKCVLADCEFAYYGMPSACKCLLMSHCHDIEPACKDIKPASLLKGHVINAVLQL